MVKPGLRDFIKLALETARGETFVAVSSPAF